MVRSRLAFLQHLLIAIVVLVLCVGGAELGLHLYEAYSACAASDNERSACAPSWTHHHGLKPEVRVLTAEPDTGQKIRWKTNSLGLRGPEVEIPKPSGVYRILCLGDESTLAAQTRGKQTFCTHLAENLAASSATEIEVINGGCPEYGPLLSYLQLRHALLGLAPDLVIFHFDMSDVVDDHRSRRSARVNGALPLYCPHPELEKQRNARESMWIHRLLTWRHCRKGIAFLIGSTEDPEDLRDVDSPQGTYAWLRDEPPDWSVYIHQTLQTLEQLSNLCHRANSEFVLSAIPCPWQISAEASNGPEVRERAGVERHAIYKSEFPVRTLAAFASKARIPFCNPVATFQRVERPERLFCRNAAHFSPTGHELYARIVGDFLVRNVAGPWQAGRSRSGPQPMPLSTRATRLEDRRPVRRIQYSTHDDSPATQSDGRTAGRGE